MEKAALRWVHVQPLLRLALPLLAIVILSESSAYARTISFAGREWTVRVGGGGPGPNHWSDSEQSVWVDNNGLHLKIRTIEDTWYCAEITSVLPVHYGMCRFYLSSRVDLLDRNIVASPFLYKDDNHEVDIEFSRWRKKSGDNAQFVIQPFQNPGNIQRFEMRLNGDFSTHCYDWRAEAIHFTSFHGHYTEPPSKDFLIQDWTYTGKDNPRESDEVRVHINLWLINGLAPSDGQAAEVLLKNADLPEPLLKTKR